MRHRLPPLNSLRLFEAAARLLSFKNAAEELLVTPSAVSHGIQSLEQWLGVPLFARTTRGLVLTEAGLRYYPTVQAALSMLVAGSAEIAARRGQRRIVLSATPTFASRLLLPLLARFHVEHPDIAVVVDTAREHAPLGEGGVDIAIRMGRGGWQGVVAAPLLRETLVPVCAPALRRELEPAADLDALPLIHVTTVSEDWARWAAATGRRPPQRSHGLRFDTIQMAFEAAARGLGVAMGRRPLVDVELAAGTLVRLFDQEVACDTAYWLVTAQDKAVNPDIRAFRDWIAARTAEAA